MTTSRALIAIMAVTAALPGIASAQTRSIRDTATAYGARLNARGQPATLNPNRVNNRILSRNDTRLALRIERYRPDSSANPTAAFEARQSDRSRVLPTITPPPPVDIDAD